METKLYAIYFKGIHRGNVRSNSIENAIKVYLIDSMLGEFIHDKDFLFYFSATIAIEKIHYTKPAFFS